MSEYIPFKSVLQPSQLANLLREIVSGIQLPGNLAWPALRGVCNGRTPVTQTLCFIDRTPSQDILEKLDQMVVLTTEGCFVGYSNEAILKLEDPRAVFIDLIRTLQQQKYFLPLTSLANQRPSIDARASIHPSAQIEDGVFIGAGTQIGSGCVIKAGTWIGEHVIVRENTVIGCDGIALHKAVDGRVLRFPHLAGVYLETEVELGASCVIPRGILTSTRIGRNSIIGNLCNIGHGSTIGEKVWMSVGTLIGGHSVIGAEATIGMGGCVRDNLRVGRNASIGMGSVVAKDVPDDTSVFGNPAKHIPSLNAGPQR